MSLIPWKNKSQLAQQGRPASMIDVMHEDLDRMIERFFEQPFAAFGRGSEDAIGGFAPPVDLSETDKEVTARAELPGMDPARIEVKISGDSLVLSGTKEESSEEKGKSFHRTERRFGSFIRRIPLPGSVDADKVTADYSNGVLTVRMQKAPDAQAKTIKVNAR